MKNQQHSPSLDKIWDVCVLTATNDSQAAVYQLQLDRLLRAGFLHPETQYLVVADPHGARIGSGGATLHVLRKLERLGIQVTPQTTAHRILVLHSGGDSRRIPHHSVLGKVFAPLPAPMYSTFEVMYRFLTTIAAHIDAGLVVACGDTLIQLDSDNAITALSDDFDAIGIAYWGPPELGERHGVYDFDPRTHEVRRCLQKASTESLRQEELCNADGQVAVDTGILVFRPRAMTQLQTLAGQLPEDAYVDLYGEILPAMAAQTDSERFGNEPLWETLHPLRFGLWSPPGLEFLHTGTTQEYLELLDGQPGESTDSQISGWLRSRSTEQSSVHCPVPLEHGWVCLAYGVTDVPTVCGEAATLFGEPISQWLGRNGLTPEVIWPKVEASERCLWNARLYPIVYSAPAADYSNPVPGWFQGPTKEWLRGDRLSMAEVMQRADRVKAFAESQEAEATEMAKAVVEKVQVEADTDVRPLFRSILTPYGYASAMSAFDEALHQIGNPLHRARLHKIASDLCVPFISKWESKRATSAPHPVDYQQQRNEHYTQAFESVQLAVSESIVPSDGLLIPDAIPPSAKNHPIRESVTIRLPVRVDLAGGWTDTPPYSLEKGGAVINAAVLLRGRYPIEVTARWIADPVIRLRSVDQGEASEIREAESLKAAVRLNDPLALHRTVLKASSIIDGDGSTFRIKGAHSRCPGLELTSHCDVPMGSGLGTSSILGAGLVMAVWQLMGIEWRDEQLFNQVLSIEQMLTAGGGWQDQVGGVIPGFKFTTTQSGIPQRFHVERLELAPETSRALEERLLLVYTSQQRVAKNILELVVADWLSRRADLVATLEQLRADAYAMRDALVSGDIEAFGHLLTRYWDGKKVLNANTTNSGIDDLLASVIDFCSGYGIAGAGGGGFLVLLAEDKGARVEIERRLENTTAVVYPWQVVPESTVVGKG